MNDTKLTCPSCGEEVKYVWQYVTEQRRYTFYLPTQCYVGRSDPVDDTSRLDYLACTRCGMELPKEISAKIQSLEELLVGP